MRFRFRPDKFIIILLAVVLLASLLPARGAFVDYLGYLTDFAVALLFFLHGARLSREAVVAGVRHWRLHLVIIAVTFVLFPLVGLALGPLSPSLLTPTLYSGILFLCVLPSTVQSSIAFTSMARGNVPAAICAASASNIFGMALTPLLVGVLLHTQGGGVSSDAVIAILLQLLAPFVAGQLLQPWIGGFVRRHNRVLGMTDRSSILLVVYGAFSKAVVAGLWQTFDVTTLLVMAAVDVVLLGCVILATTYGSRLLGFSKEDEITIVFCGSKKSLVSGIPMANVIFPAQAVGAIVLPLMLYHQIQLMVCAAMAQHYAARRPPDADKPGEDGVRGNKEVVTSV
ncbi:MAG: bile acid:sodium symporter [Chelatococcus sp.]|uniref:bile acid:sodium symporter family protein n=1 Tax=unclassified Chelatococcus TaxID=2638111 RepID=UPI001BD14C6F|nr:bile acid:sodium symporter family protein [Chelatococcus sp.]MBS7739903.1 bile acid:sodium symporter [Chelatococcus sp. HY11]MBX3536599.1 bile acid:sodium symporter [Chelatococcus sp.]MBX3545547.1 bile acid:sodium symporter [Chelatococcus sp.]MCO5078797.1 bile acid:sodium symporter [Chelatococcus sp.]